MDHLAINLGFRFVARPVLRFHHVVDHAFPDLAPGFQLARRVGAVEAVGVARVAIAVLRWMRHRHSACLAPWKADHVSLL